MHNVYVIVLMLQSFAIRLLSNAYNIQGMNVYYCVRDAIRTSYRLYITDNYVLQYYNIMCSM